MQILEELRLVNAIKKTQTFLPIAKKACDLTTSTVMDDLALRTSLTNPAKYDSNMTAMLHNYSLFTSEDGQPIKINHNVFCETISNTDKMYLLWAFYKASYESLDDKRKIICTNPDCGKEFTEEIMVEDLFHEDTFKIWEEDVPFYNYEYKISVEYAEKVTFEFIVRYPSIMDNNRVLSMMDNATLQKNLRELQTSFTKSQQMLLYIKRMNLVWKAQSRPTLEVSDIKELQVAMRDIPSIVAEEFFEKYNEKFGQYDPKFYKSVTCDYCAKTFDYNVDLEIEFFRRSVFGRRSGI